MNKDYSNKEYQQYVDTKSPKSNIVKDTIMAFIIGGLICVLGEAIANYLLYRGIAEETVKLALPIIMIGLSAFFTGLGWYQKLAKHGGAGTLVPIAGFANAVVSPALEFKTEGQVLGIGAKMFIIAGPVIVFGTITSIIAGFIYFLVK